MKSPKMLLVFFFGYFINFPHWMCIMHYKRQRGGKQRGGDRMSLDGNSFKTFSE